MFKQSRGFVPDQNAARTGIYVVVANGPNGLVSLRYDRNINLFVLSIHNVATTQRKHEVIEWEHNTYIISDVPFGSLAEDSPEFNWQAMYEIAQEKAI